MIYFVRHESGQIKIGTTTALTTRIKALEIEHGKLEIIGVMEGGREEERLIHAKFASFRTHGEWFKPEPALAEFIAVEGREWDGSDEATFHPFVSLKGTDDYEAWVDRLVDHAHLGTRSLLIRNALRVFAKSVDFGEDPPKR